MEKMRKHSRISMCVGYEELSLRETAKEKNSYLINQLNPTHKNKTLP